MRRFACGLASAALSVVATVPAHAGSYLQSGGDYNYSLGLGYIVGDKEWDDRSRLQDLGCTSRYAFNSHYLEYGYSYYHTLFGGVNIADARCGADSKAGFGDVRLGVRGRLDDARNNRAWELQLNVPTSADTSGSARLGCGVFGLYGGLATKEQLGESLALGGEAGIQLWEAPLAQQFEGRLSLDGTLGARSVSPWSWDLDLTGYTPLARRYSGIRSGASDCGTDGKLVRAAAGIGYRWSRESHFKCNVTAGAWGENSTRRQGLICGYSRLFKR